MKNILFILAFVLTISWMVYSKRGVINSQNAPKAIGPYSQAILADNTLYLSGQIALDPKSGELKNNSIKEEVEQIMKNHLEILKEANMDYSNIVKASVFLKNIEDFKEFNEIYGKYFPENPPARETVEVSRLPKNANIEISFIAVK